MMNEMQEIDLQDQSSGQQPRRTSAIIQIVGSTLCTFVGAVIGLSVPGDGNLADVSLVCLMAFCGWLFWVRRRKPMLETVGFCIGLIIAWLPIAYFLRRISGHLH
jgi:hypothetical protein